MSDLFVILDLRISYVLQYTPDYQLCECLDLEHYDSNSDFSDTINKYKLQIDF